MRAAGIAVGLGSDSVASNNRVDLLDEARLAVFMQQAQPASTTLGARAAVPWPRWRARAPSGSMTGRSLDVGKAADLVAFPLDGLHVSPVHEPEGALLFAASARGASLVMVAGRTLVRGGALVSDVSADVEVVRAAALDLRRVAESAG